MVIRGLPRETANLFQTSHRGCTDHQIEDSLYYIITRYSVITLQVIYPYRSWRSLFQLQYLNIRSDKNLDLDMRLDGAQDRALLA